MKKNNNVVEFSSRKFSEYISENYKEVAEIIFDEDEVTAEGDIMAMQAFHAEKVHMLEASDDYLFGIRANHFVVEEGMSESFVKIIGQGMNDKDFIPYPCFLVSANHKGIRIQKLYVEEHSDE